MIMPKYSLIKKGSSRRASSVRNLQRIALALALVAAAAFVMPKVLTGLAQLVFAPFDAVRIWVTQSQDSLPQYLRDRHALIQEIEILKASVATDQGDQNTIRKLQFENEQLRSLVGEIPEERDLARVIARPNQLPYDMVMLDRGSEEGVVEGAPVFVGQDQLIGVVSDVRTNTSLVTLVTTSGFTSTAYVMGANIYTYAEGMGGGIMRVRIPQDIPLHVGDIVMLPAVNSTGVFGAVAAIENSPTQPEQYGYVPLKVSLQSLQYVSIGRESIVPQTYEEARAQVDLTLSKLLQVDLPPGVLVTPETETASTTATSTASTTLDLATTTSQE